MNKVCACWNTLICCLIIGILPTTAQQSSHHWSLSGTLIDTVLNKPVPYVTVYARKNVTTYKTVSDQNGFFMFKELPSNFYSITVSALNYKSQDIGIRLNKNENLIIPLTQLLSELNEVYVTAAESKGITSSSIIDRDAMQLLQPSSFTDLLELLPGGTSTNPNLTEMNQVRIRESNPPNNQFDATSLGIAFYVDNAPINTSANMQTLSGFSLSSPNDDRVSVNKGVDMRTLSTDQIARVEIVRGISSVEYGDLTSGLIKIERKKGQSPLSIRIKSDGFSKLVAGSKGITFKNNFTINLDADFLDSKSDPRNNYENYKRLGTSLRTEKSWEFSGSSIKWNAALDLASNIDNEKDDPDNSYAATDRYRSSYQSYAMLHQFSLKLKDQQSFVNSIDLTAKLSYDLDKIDMVKLIQAGSAAILANSLVEGAHDASYITPSYTGHMIVDGKPFNAYIKAATNLRYFTGSIRHQFKIGSEANFSKNYGNGQVYDLNFPLSSSASTNRPRAFKSIPSMQNLSFYGEDAVNLLIGNQQIDAVAGVRASSLLGMGSQYLLANHVYADPRVNIRWSIPTFHMGKNPFSLSFGGGWGMLTKFPTLKQLYPDPQYVDLIQLNFYHNNAEYRKANVMTYILDGSNYNLTAARNKKWEFNTDISFMGNRLSVTYYREKMTSGFRSTSQYSAFAYKSYLNSSVDAANMTAAPSLSDFDYKELKEYYSYSIPSNGSATIKEGIEYQLTTARISVINTRFTLNGAWFKTAYLNSLPNPEIIDTKTITDGKVRQYIGFYQDDDGYLSQQFNTNLTIDSYLPKTGLNLSASIQSTWFSTSQSAYKSGTPYQYMDIGGNIYDYTEADKTDPNLQVLNKNYNETQFRKYKTPLDMEINLKASKNLKKRARISMFVNRIVTYSPDYISYGVKIRRQGLDSPYFGMELNVNF
ncbi:Outer membrane receptor proteins, mostly Fe transport [bacterium A37T11]|nr:Outer membrane receptor proteins, mostly Fe transport [bacterium A37T11]